MNHETDSQALAVREPASAITLTPVMSNHELDSLFRLAKALAMSGMFKDARQAEQALAKILVGRDLGLSPTQALMGIHIVEGKPELSANLQAAFVKQAPGYDYRVIEHTDRACEIAYLRGGEEVGRSRFTIEDAQRAGLAGRNVWKSYPANMLFARAMSNGVAFHCPEVTGGVRVYAEGEISGEEEPAAIEGTVEPAVPVPDAQATEDASLPEGLRTGLFEMSKALINKRTWTAAALREGFVAAGATDTSSVMHAIDTLPREGAAELYKSMVDQLATNENGARS